jgi:HK97 family phage portal protein
MLRYLIRPSRWAGAVMGLFRRAGTQRGVPSHAGSAAVAVSFDSAMQVSAWWAGVRILAETVASLPLVMYRFENGRRVVADRHPLWRVLAKKPNRYQTKVEFFETLMLNLVCHGNAYCLIQRSGGQVVGLLPLMTAQMETRLLDDGTVVHAYSHDEQTDVLAAENVWHLKLMGNGVIGLSPMDHARNALGIAQAAETRASRLFRNGGKPTGVLTIDKVLTKEQRDAVKRSFSELAEGNGDELIVLEAGFAYSQVSLSPEDMELLNTRRFQIEDVARFLGVPSVLINDTAGSTTWGSGIQQIIEGWYKLGLRASLEKIEGSAMLHLLSDADQRVYEIEFDFDALLRADPLARYQANQAAISSGQLTPNEARTNEGRQPLAGGDELLVQGALVPLSRIGNTQEVTRGT